MLHDKRGWVLRCIPVEYFQRPRGKEARPGCGEHFAIWTSEQEKGQWKCRCGKKTRANLRGSVAVKAGPFKERWRAKQWAWNLNQKDPMVGNEDLIRTERPLHDEPASPEEYERLQGEVG